MVACLDYGIIHYEGSVPQLIADVGTIVFAMRENILKMVDESERESFLKDYEKMVLATLATPTGLDEETSAKTIIKTIHATEKNP